jgi:D-alanyl-D-alanine-carboxypeptidase/D-alanyl-D-alanine-endopeptidase
MRVLLVLAALVTGGSSAVVAAAPPIACIPDDAEVRRILDERVQEKHLTPGIVVGIIDGRGRRILVSEAAANASRRPLDGDSVFELGSITKIFTSLVLADAVQRGELSLSDRIDKFLPIQLSQVRGRSITMLDLAMHTSGLPRDPPNKDPKYPSDVYGHYSVEQLYQFLSTFTARWSPGERYEYSNLGGALLGHVLSRMAGTDYESLALARVARPLGMASTRIALSEDMRSRLAPGHSRELTPVASSIIPALPGVGAMRSTANDLLTLLAAHLGYVDTPLARAMTMMTAHRRETNVADLDVAMAWHIVKADGEEVVWQDGVGGGYRSFIGFNREYRTGAVVLTNSNVPVTDDLGFYLMMPRRRTVALGLVPPEKIPCAEQR